MPKQKPHDKRAAAISEKELERSILEGPERRFLEPRLLMLIQMSPDYGYKLTDTLAKLPFPCSPPDSAAVYRMLRRLEKIGYVRSEWEHAETGPSKRVYRITPAGKKRLAAWVAIIKKRVELLKDFIEMCEAVQQ